MKNVNYILPLLLLSLMIIIPCTDFFAQCIGPTGTNNGVPCCLVVDGCGPFGCPNCDGIDVPLDGGLSALLIAGVAYGAKKIRSKLN